MTDTPHETAADPVLSGGEPDERTVSLTVLCVLALLIGVVAAAGAVIFRFMISLAHNVIFLGKFGWFYDANQYDPESLWGPLVILSPVVGGLIVVWLVGKFGWKPIIKGLTDRENSIRTDLETAKAEREKAGALLADYKQAMANAKKEAADIIQKAQDSADKHRAEAEAEAKQQGQKLIEKARVDIERESDAAKAELSRHVAELTAKATSRLLGRVIDDKEHERLIMEALKEDR